MYPTGHLAEQKICEKAIKYTLHAFTVQLLLEHSNIKHYTICTTVTYVIAQRPLNTNLSGCGGPYIARV